MGLIMKLKIAKKSCDTATLNCNQKPFFIVEEYRVQISLLFNSSWGKIASGAKDWSNYIVTIYWTMLQSLVAFYYGGATEQTLDREGKWEYCIFVQTAFYRFIVLCIRNNILQIWNKEKVKFWRDWTCIHLIYIPFCYHWAMSVCAEQIVFSYTNPAYKLHNKSSWDHWLDTVMSLLTG